MQKIMMSPRNGRINRKADDVVLFKVKDMKRGIRLIFSAYSTFISVVTVL